jgi:hypothetical protein
LDQKMTQASKRTKITADSDGICNHILKTSSNTKASVWEQMLLPYIYAPQVLKDHHIVVNEMMPKDKKAFDHISVAMPAGFEEEFSGSPTLMEIRDELLMDYFPVHMPSSGWTEAEWRVVPTETARALCSMEIAHVRAPH